MATGARLLLRIYQPRYRSGNGPARPGLRHRQRHRHIRHDQCPKRSEPVNAMLQSFDPASRELIWEGPVASADDCHLAIAAARTALPGWRALPVDDRIAVARRYAAVLGERRAALAELISRETGKLLWESDAEIGSMIAKVDVSIKAHAERTGERSADMPFGRAILRHRGHGVMAVLGPYNFPGHLPNGHIVPALIAGNAIVFKPSEITPATGAAMADAWTAAGLPDGLLTVVQGGRSPCTLR
eukprot:Opistho-1_new@104467